MDCVLCGKTSIDGGFELFQFSPSARKMLQIQFGFDPDENLASDRICGECLVLPIKLAENAIKNELDELRHYSIREALHKSRN
jgi:hypothetical protein